MPVCYKYKANLYHISLSHSCIIIQKSIIIKKAFQSLIRIANFKMVGPERLELSHIAALDPKSSASTNFATGPHGTCIFLNYTKITLLSIFIVYCLINL